MKLSEVPVNGVYEDKASVGLCMVLAKLGSRGQKRVVCQTGSLRSTTINTDINNPKVVYLGQGRVVFRVELNDDT